MITRIAIAVFILFIAGRFSFVFGAEDKTIGQAGSLYAKGKLDEALEKYNLLAESYPDSDVINFNRGVVLYKKGVYDEAAGSFIKALVSSNKRVEADALYNLGNSKYMEGKLKEESDLSSTVSLLNESLEYYKRAIEIDKTNKDARFNYEFVDKELKILSDKLREEQKNSGKCPLGNEGKKNGEKSEKSQGQGQEEKKQDMRQAGADKQAGKDKDEKKQGATGRQEGQPQDKPIRDVSGAGKEDKGEEGKIEELSKEGAQAILERYGREDGVPNYSIEENRSSADDESLYDW